MFSPSERNIGFAQQLTLIEGRSRGIESVLQEDGELTSSWSEVFSRDYSSVSVVNGHPAKLTCRSCDSVVLSSKLSLAAAFARPRRAVDKKAESSLEGKSMRLSSSLNSSGMMRRSHNAVGGSTDERSSRAFTTRRSTASKRSIHRC